MFTYLSGLRGRGSNCKDSICTGQHNTHNLDIHPFLELHLNPRSLRSSDRIRYVHAQEPRDVIMIAFLHVYVCGLCFVYIFTAFAL
jgi:hypothetical protein